MVFSMDSTFKRAIFIAIVVAVNIIFLFTAFFYLPELNQKSIAVYLLIIQAFVIVTFFLYRKQTTARVIQVKKLKNPRLQENAFEVTKLLFKEYEYITTTAAQVQKDRNTLLNQFIFFSALIAAIVLFLVANPEHFFSQSGVVGLSILCNIIGWIFFLNLVRFRQAWWSCAEAMNQIKDFFIINSRLPDDIARTTFLWDSRTLPRAGKKSNNYYYTAMVIAVIASSFLLISSWAGSSNLQAPTLTTFSALLALYHFLFQMTTYSLFLDFKPIR